MEIIGRDKEKTALKQCMESNVSEFLVVYGRRRVGKTFLIREFFNGEPDFYVTGLASEKKDDQLQAWNTAIKYCFGGSENSAANWIDAFTLLRNKIEKTEKGLKIEAFLITTAHRGKGMTWTNLIIGPTWIEVKPRDSIGLLKTINEIRDLLNSHNKIN